MVDRPLFYLRKDEKIPPDTLVNRLRGVFGLREKTRTPRYLQDTKPPEDHTRNHVLARRTQDADKISQTKAGIPQVTQAVDKATPTADPVALENGPTKEIFLLSPQEEVIYTHAFAGLLLQLNAPEDDVSGVNSEVNVAASDLYEVLQENKHALSRQLHRVFSNGPENYLAVRDKAVSKMDRFFTNSREFGVLDPNSALQLGLVVMDKDHALEIHEGLQHMVPEEILSYEFPRGVSEDQIEVKEEEQKVGETIKDQVENLISRFDDTHIYDTRSGVKLHAPYMARLFRGVFDVKNFHKAEGLGIISVLGKDGRHNINTYTRRDLIRLYWAVTYYNVRGMQKLSESQKAELDEIGRVYEEVMEERRLRSQGKV